MNYLDTVDEFRLDLERKNRAKSTIKSYKSAVVQFLKFQADQGKEPLIYTDVDIIGYLEHKLDDGISRASIGKAVPAINAFSSFIDIDIEINISELAFLNDIEQKEAKVIILSDHVQKRMYQYAARVYKKRNISMILMLLETGIKLSELVSLNREDLERIDGNPYITVNSKNKRTLRLSEDLYSHIEHTFKSRTDQCEALFISSLSQRLSDRSVIHAMQRHGNLTTQIIRDTYIFNLISKDVDTYIMAQLAGITHTDTFIKKYYKDEPEVIDEFVEVVN